MFHLFALYLWQIVGYVMDRVSAMLSEAMLISLCGGGVVSYMTDQILQTTCVFPSHVHQKKIWLQLLLHPKGNFQKFLPSSFVRNEALFSRDWLKYVLWY